MYLYIDENESWHSSKQTDEDGKAEFIYSIASGFTGTHKFRVNASSSQTKLTKTYTIGDYQPGLTAPATAKAGDEITVNYTDLGWAKYSDSQWKSVSIDFYVGGQYVTYDYISPAEFTVISGSKTIRIPYTASGNVLLGIKSSDGYYAETTVNVTPSAAAVSITPENARCGDTLTVSAAGFAPNEYVYLYKDLNKENSYSTNKQADASGNAVFTYRLTQYDSGSSFFEARGYTSGLERSCAIDVLPPQE